MKGQIVTLIAILVFGILSLVFHFSNKYLDSVIKCIPILIPTFALFINKPENYLKYMYFKKSNINCVFKSKISECSINEHEFNEIIQVFLDDKESMINDNKLINKTISNYNYDADLKVSSSYMKLNYDIEKMQFYMEFEGELSYKNFILRVEKLHEKLICALNVITYKEQLHNLTIIYNGSKTCNNPFIEGLFKSFDNKNFSMTYLGKNQTKINISNNRISLTSNSIIDLNKDLNSQLSPFKFR